MEFPERPPPPLSISVHRRSSCFPEIPGVEEPWYSVSMDSEITLVTPVITLIRMFVIPGCPANCFVVRGPRTNLVIDTGFGQETADEIRLHLDPSKRTLVINTHSHWDHVWGNAAFSEDILAHTACPAKISARWDQDRTLHPDCVRGDLPMRLPNLLFSHEFLLPDDGVELFWTPGHTTDGINLWFPRDRILFAGDNVGDNEDNPLPELENSVEDYAGAVERYRRLQPRLVLSGHHTPAGPGFLDQIARALDGS